MRRFFNSCLILPLIVPVLLLGFGCKKGSSPEPAVYSIHGVWTGTASNATITIPYYLTVKPDGTCTFEGISAGNEEDFGYGTWSLSGSAFTAKLTTLYGVWTNIGVQQTVTGVFNSHTGTLTSLTWTDTLGAVDNGTFALAKADEQIQGLWAGTASNATITIPYYLSVKPDGTCTFEGISAGNQEDFGAGTWTLNGTTFTANLTTLYGVWSNIGVKQTVTGVFDSKSGTLTSLTWTDILGAFDNGTFSLSKAN